MVNAFLIIFILAKRLDNNLEANYYAQVQIDDCKRNLVLSEIPKIKRCGDILPQSFINQSDGIIVVLVK